MATQQPPTVPEFDMELDLRQLLLALRRVRKGDFSVRLPGNLTGIGGEISEAFNEVVEMNDRLYAGLERINKAVGRDGRISQRLSVPGATGAWADSVDSVNTLIGDLVQPTIEVARVITAVAKGDLSQTMALEIEGRPLKGEFLRTARTVNTMVSQLGSFADEVTRVAREVGTEGKLGAQATVKGVAGIWKDLTDNVNQMAANLTSQVRNIAEVTTAVANGDLSKKITVEVKGEILELKNIINTMVDQLRSFAGEVTRVAREVGTEGKLGGQAQVPGVAGVWKDLTDNVNQMAANLTGQVRNIAEVTTAVANGDLSRKITVEVKGEILELKNTINTMVDQLNGFAGEVTRVAREVGTEGKLGGQAQVPGVAGVWKDLTDNVNYMAANLTSQVRNIAEVTTAVANGDLSKKITVEVKGEILELKNTINTMVDQLNSFAGEVIRVAREVGTEGKLGGQAVVRGVAGVWKDLTDNVNYMAANLTNQVRNIAAVTTAVARGDLSKKITVDVRGEILELKNTINTMVDQLNSFASEVTRVAREVGTEGKLGGQAQVGGVAGVWKDLTENVNQMAANLTGQVRNIAEVTTAVANGDLSKKITVDVKGEILELKNTINTMVDQLNSFASEVTRVAREVGTEGKLGGQAIVKGVAGVWKDLTDNVNYMAANLTNQVRNIADVTTAVANGDLSKKITVDVRGEILELKNTINTMVDQLNSFASEVTRVAREVGTEGKLGGQAVVKGVAGVWKDLTDNVNYMAANLTSQVRNIAEVTTAVARGDLSRKITVDVKGEILELKNTINTMVDQLNSFASEVTRVAREVGTEGKLGGQANVLGVGGVWKDLTDNVNYMAANLTNQVRNIAEVTTAVANGDLSRKITVDVRGEILELKNTINTMVDQLNSFASEVTRVAREVGTEGKLGGQAAVKGVAGVWKDLTDNVNYMAANLTNQVRNIAEVTTAVARGDLSKKITVDVQGEILELKNTINTMVDQLNSFASEVTRVAREVGTEGKLGGQAEVLGVAGVWKGLTDNVNSMAANLTSQVRGIAKVVTAVANGDLKKKLTVEAKGEIETLADTINGMIDTLATFADQVTTVAREVGVEGRLGGQASVPGASGTWKDLTDNVNQLAANLTTQVRAIAEVATAVTKGDLTRSIQVDARGEVAALKDNINEMIRNLRESMRTNTEQDWLKTNLARFTRILQGHKDLETVSNLILSELAPLVAAQHGAFYLSQNWGELEEERMRLVLRATYAYRSRKSLSNIFDFGEGLVGQAAREKQRILITNVPPDYIQISSGLGEAPPLNIVVLPILFEGQVRGVVELASFNRFTDIHLALLDQLAEIIGIVLNTITVMMRTEELLKESQALAKELSSQPQLREANERLAQQAAALRASEELLRQQQEELRKTNEELAEKARLLTDQNREMERINREIERARQALEEKAEQLALTSRYKSEFLANMSHELRTPLNSLLILARMLSDNPEKNLSPKQVECARTIYASGTDLLNLINDILDLSKIESGTVTIEPGEISFSELDHYVQRNFRQMAMDKGLEFDVTLDPRLPGSMTTDPKRLQQILKNLISNAIKFTHDGKVSLTISPAFGGWTPGHPMVSMSDMVIAFTVTDSGIGIPGDKHEIIFEAFQQVDGATHRKYGGTGLGLSISRELAVRLGGEITVESQPGVGSTFTLFLPRHFVGRDGTDGDGGTGGRLAGDGSERQALASVLATTVPTAASAPTLALLRPGALSGGSPLPAGVNGEAGGVHAEVAMAAVETATATVEAAPEDPAPDLPEVIVEAEPEGDADAPRPTGNPLQRLTPLEDDRDRIGPGDRILLIIANEEVSARSLVQVAHEASFRAVVARRGDSVLPMLQKWPPDAIVLEIRLPEHDGWTVLDRLKRNPQTRHIPVLVVSDEDQEARALRMGGFSFLRQPIGTGAMAEAVRKMGEFVQRRQKRLLVVEDNEVERDEVIRLIGDGEDVATTAVATGAEALEALKTEPFDCVVLDIGLPDMDGVDLLEQVQQELGTCPPVVVYTGRELTPDQVAALKKMGTRILVKSAVTPERLLDETALYLHRHEAAIPDDKRLILRQAAEQDPILAGRNVLVVDDDLRNLFAIRHLLERQKMEVTTATTGAEALEILDARGDFDVVLMDIMMPEMDGYTTMQEIRRVTRYRTLPIIALTAKAMPGDREKCLQSGASDYIPKPVDPEQLVSLLRVWLLR